MHGLRITYLPAKTFQIVSQSKIYYKEEWKIPVVRVLTLDAHPLSRYRHKIALRKKKHGIIIMNLCVSNMNILQVSLYLFVPCRHQEAACACEREKFIMGISWSFPPYLPGLQQRKSCR